MLEQTFYIFADSNFRADFFDTAGKFKKQGAARILKPHTFAGVAECLAREAGLDDIRFALPSGKINSMNILRENICSGGKIVFKRCNAVTVYFVEQEMSYACVFKTKRRSAGAGE